MPKCTLRIPDGCCGTDRAAKVFQAEKLLLEAGISFDTGCEMRTNTREWEFDTLEGAELKCRE